MDLCTAGIVPGGIVVGSEDVPGMVARQAVVVVAPAVAGVGPE